MNLRTQTDYALRAVLYLAHRQQMVTVDEIAKAYGISKDHLVKVVQQLARMGYVQSQAGRHGGVRLAKDPAAINVGELVGQFEGRNGVLPCINDVTYCNLEPGCTLRSLLIRAEDAFYNMLEKVTIAELMASNVAKKSGGFYNLTIASRKDGDTSTAPNA
jgi:Rrf2 family nitric oxide-sensitive transcriptional repressor